MAGWGGVRATGLYALTFSGSGRKKDGKRGSTGKTAVLFRAAVLAFAEPADTDLALFPDEAAA